MARLLGSQRLHPATAALLLLPVSDPLLVPLPQGMDMVPLLLKVLHLLAMDLLLAHPPSDTEVRQDPHPEGMALHRARRQEIEVTLDSTTTISSPRKEATQDNMHIQRGAIQGNNTYHRLMEPMLIINKDLPLVLLHKFKTTGRTSKVPIIGIHNLSFSTLSVAAKRRLFALESITSDRKESSEGVSMM